VVPKASRHRRMTIGGFMVRGHVSTPDWFDTEIIINYE
jgi:hypothetical protein